RALGMAWSQRAMTTRQAGRRLEAAAFRRRVFAAVERRSLEAYRFALHRVRLDGDAEDIVERLADALAARTRAGDATCVVAPRELLVLCAGPPHAFEPVAARARALWRELARAGEDAREPAFEALEVRDAQDVEALVPATP